MDLTCHACGRPFANEARWYAVPVDGVWRGICPLDMGEWLRSNTSSENPYSDDVSLRSDSETPGRPPGRTGPGVGSGRAPRPLLGTRPA